MTRSTILAPVSAALALGLLLTGCGAGDDDTAETPTTTEAAEATTEPTTDAETTPGEDASDDGATPSATSQAAGDDDRTAAGLAAIATAEAEADGVAYAIDDEDDDNGWEVDVRTGDSSFEVRTGPDGSVVGTEDDDIDADDLRALDGVDVTLAEAVEAAVAETGGVLDDAEISSDDGAVQIEVTVDTADRDDVDVVIDPSSGEVVRVE